MEILLGNNAGFCYGVNNAVSNTRDILEKCTSVDCLGELVHNGEVVRKLEDLGLRVIKDIENSNSKVIIRAHGIAKEVYHKAKKLNIELFDFTCPKVLNIHNISQRYSDDGYYIFLIGGEKHPESIGTISFCGDQSCLIETKEQIDEGIELLKKSNIKKLLIIVQTTFSLEKFNDFVKEIKLKVPLDVEVEVKNTICNATKMRQEETEEISKKVDCMIIIGGKNSSNTRKLYEIAEKNCNNVFMIETKDELDKENVYSFNKIGIMAGASTPKETIDEVITKLKC